MRTFLITLSGASVAAALACGGAPAEPPAAEGDAEAAAADAAADPRDRFVGAWKLVRVERYDAAGALQPPPAPGEFGAGSPLGYLMYDGEHMGVVIQQEGRRPYAGDEPTPDEALAALTSYTSYFGPYTVNEAEGYVTHHVIGSLSPGFTGQDNQRFYEFSGDELALQPPAGPSGGRLRIVWEKVPELDDMPAEQRRFLGFWRIAEVEQQSLDGESMPVDQYAEGYIIYMPSGLMAVHLMREPDRPTYAGESPTADEAAAAVRTYGGYFGPFTVHADDGYVMHRRTGGVDPGAAGVDAQRFYEFRGDRLVLMPPPREVDGRTVRRFIHWDRISTLDAPG